MRGILPSRHAPEPQFVPGVWHPFRRTEGRTAIFSRRANLFVQIGLALLLIVAVCFLLLIWGVPLMDYNDQVGLTSRQPVPFSHKHHVSGLGIDCRYCHDSVEYASNAGMPPTETCMSCHSQVWTNAAIPQPVRRSLAEHQPILFMKLRGRPSLKWVFAAAGFSG